MKILLINKFYYHRGGAETVFFQTKGLLESAGHKVVVFSMKDVRNEESPYADYFVSPIDFEHYEGLWQQIRKFLRSIYSMEAKQKLQKLIDKEEPDIVHIHNFEHQLTPSILFVLRKNKLPVVQTLHDFQLISPSYNLQLGDYDEKTGVKLWRILSQKRMRQSFGISLWAIVEFYLQKWFRFYESKVDAFISPSIFLKKQCERRGVKKNVHVLANPVAVLDSDEPNKVGSNLVCVSRLVAGKGVKELIDVIGQMGDIRMDIVGHGPLFGIFKKHIEEQNYTKVNLLGAMKPREVKECLQAAKLVVVPTLFYENQPMVILEAMAAGKAVLAANVGGIPELIESGKTGWLYKVGDSDELRQVLQDIWPQSQLLEKVGRGAYEFIRENFDERKYVRELVQIYLQYMNRKVKMG